MSEQRLIRFRVWDIQNERMVSDPDRFEPAYNDYELAISPWVFYETWQDREDGIRRPCHVMQHTGLHDSLGADIWESDIVQFGSAIGEIVWNFDGWQIKWITQNEGLRNSANKLSTKISTKKIMNSKVLTSKYQLQEQTENP
jgi:hypothetical protein